MIEAEHAPAHAHAPMNILIVEDSADDRALYRRMLDRNGVSFQVFEASSISEGLALAREKNMDCILLDYQLPDGDGFDFINSCQEQDMARNAAIVMVTGRGSERTAVEAMKRGALDYITKGGIPETYFMQSILNAIERAQLKEAVGRYQRELEESYDALSEFAHTASHDLKAPLRHITSYCNLISEDFAGKIGDEGKEYLRRLVVNATRLQRLIDDLLSYSEALNAVEETGSVDGNAVASEIVEMLEEDIRETKAVISVGKLPVLEAYPLRLRQLFQNLLTNALKYRQPGRDPVVSVTAEDKGAEWLFRFQDNGCGIEPQFQEVIFQPFKRLHRRDEKEGSGLGLSICRKITDMHGGKIWVEPAPGGGSIFSVTLPKQPALVAQKKKSTVHGDPAARRSHN